MTDAEPYQPPQTDPQPEAPVADLGPWQGPLWRAFPLALGAALSGFTGLYACLMVVWGLMILAFGAAQQDSVLALVIGFPVLLTATAFGHGLTLGKAWARYPLAAIGLLLAGGQALGASNGALRTNWALVILGLLNLLVLIPKFNDWFDPDQRERLHSASNRAYAAAIRWLAAWVAFLTVSQNYKQMYEEVGIEVPFGAGLVFATANLMEGYALFVLPLLVVAPLPLLRVRGPAWRLVHGLGACGVAFGVFALSQALIRLISNL